MKFIKFLLPGGDFEILPAKSIKKIWSQDGKTFASYIPNPGFTTVIEVTGMEKIKFPKNIL